jgi:hypothetical protein
LHEALAAQSSFQLISAYPSENGVRLSLPKGRLVGKSPIRKVKIGR